MELAIRFGFGGGGGACAGRVGQVVHHAVSRDHMGSGARLVSVEELENGEQKTAEGRLERDRGRPVTIAVQLPPQFDQGLTVVPPRLLHTVVLAQSPQRPGRLVHLHRSPHGPQSHARVLERGIPLAQLQTE